MKEVLGRIDYRVGNLNIYQAKGLGEILPTTALIGAGALGDMYADSFISEVQRNVKFLCYSKLF